MGSFDNILGAEQTLFSNIDALDPDFIPKLLPHREEQQKYIATIIKPLFQDRPGTNLLIRGSPGIGKTACVKRVLLDLEEETEDITPIFINCWKQNTSHKILSEILSKLGYKFGFSNLRTDEVMNLVSKIAKQRKAIVFTFDEIDKAEDQDFLYFILEEIPKKSILLITNNKEWGSKLDTRVQSRLLPELLEFPKYSTRETYDILKERIKYAFYQNTWADEALDAITEKASDLGDIRVGIMLLKAAGNEAENQSSKKIIKEHAQKAIEKSESFKIKSDSAFTDEDKLILNICKENSGKQSKELYDLYKTSGGDKSDRTFRRKLEALAKKNIILIEKSSEDIEGGANIIKFKGF